MPGSARTFTGAPTSATNATDLVGADGRELGRTTRRRRRRGRRRGGRSCRRGRRCRGDDSPPVRVEDEVSPRTADRAAATRSDSRVYTSMDPHYVGSRGPSPRSRSRRRLSSGREAVRLRSPRRCRPAKQSSASTLTPSAYVDRRRAGPSRGRSTPRGGFARWVAMAHDSPAYPALVVARARKPSAAQHLGRADVPRVRHDEELVARMELAKTGAPISRRHHRSSRVAARGARHRA